jgi:hypothetical protein
MTVKLLYPAQAANYRLPIWTCQLGYEEFDSFQLRAQSDHNPETGKTHLVLTDRL